MSKSNAELIKERLEREANLYMDNKLSTEEIERENALLMNKFLQEQQLTGNKTKDVKTNGQMNKLTFKLFLMQFIWGPICSSIIALLILFVGLIIIWLII